MPAPVDEAASRVADRQRSNRIEIGDAASLGIAGLLGPQVATNVISPGRPRRPIERCSSSGRPDYPAPIIRKPIPVPRVGEATPAPPVRWNITLVRSRTHGRGAGRSADPDLHLRTTHTRVRHPERRPRGLSFPNIRTSAPFQTKFELDGPGLLMSRYLTPRLHALLELLPHITAHRRDLVARSILRPRPHHRVRCSTAGSMTVQRRTTIFALGPGPA
jgi:hypothetical protein